MSDVFLKPELVPRPLWGRSVFGRLKDSGRSGEWQKLRRAVLDDASDTCAYCGYAATSHLICHEEWHYDDARAVVMLIGFAIACQYCNLVLHIGRAGTRDVDRGEEAIAHMMKVNQMTEPEAKAIIRDAFAEWRRRSKKKWTFEVAPDVATRFPIVVDALGLDG
jgi:hypothetical protein